MCVRVSFFSIGGIFGVVVGGGRGVLILFHVCFRDNEPKKVHVREREKVCTTKSRVERGGGKLNTETRTEIPDLSSSSFPTISLSLSICAVPPPPP